MNVSSNLEEIIKLTRASQALFMSSGLIIFIIGTFGNLANIILFIRLESLKTLASSMFLLASFFGNESVLIFGLLPRVIQGFQYYDFLGYSAFLCKARWYLRTVSATFALTSVCFASVDRYLVSCVNVHLQRFTTLNRARWTILIAAIFWLVVLSPFTVFYTTTAQSCFIADVIFAKFASYYSLFFYSILPFSILSIFSALTWRNLGVQQAIYVRAGGRLYDQITRMLIAQIIVLVFTSFPNAIFQLYTILTSTSSTFSLHYAQDNLANDICLVVGDLTFALPFYVYWIASPIFRKNVKSMLLIRRRITPPTNIQIA
ncbi:unnamed protein product [Rotaria socialis]|uniref:G-protein coupled receptors family 1 profile domain-containing protein n=1 Tax=Rotaria socialis TaxID=392032 RepID=A0A821Q645_9BILA|nr:unnamed protein product [Rotaria socialis]CAF3354890.1 unnamed protein product [Rotaria socialis]CAF3382050.1 unnamed protein product [Rotaria socialis]CAF3392446.1 unnamed protein product [Rotaria socialis]CAF4174382.1 unnamed protein product [Rotaria socialis]